MTDAELEQEAARLAGLDEAGREREAIKQALRIGELSREASQELMDLDRRILAEIVGDTRIVEILD